MARAQAAVLAAQHPLHIDELLRALGRDVNKRNRTSLAGSIGGYARRGRVFVKSGPNTFSVSTLEEGRRKDGASEVDGRDPSNRSDAPSVSVELRSVLKKG